MIRNAGASVIAGLLISCAIMVPALAAVAEDIVVPKSSDLPAQDDPVRLALLKNHIAYNGQVQDARMRGIIAYIDTISKGEGAGDLRNIRDDYLIAASSVPLMQTANDIKKAQDEMQQHTVAFSETTKMQLATFGGNTTVMRGEADDAEESFEKLIRNKNESLWLADDSARLSIFNRESRERTNMLRSLKKQGVDVALAKNLSEQIDAQRPELRKIIANKSLPAFEVLNAGITIQNREFRKVLGEYRSNLSIELKHAAILAMG